LIDAQKFVKNFVVCAMKACVVNAGRLDFDRQVDFGQLEAAVEVSVWSYHGLGHVAMSVTLRS